MNSKRGQEEIVGFVLIVAIVSIVLVIFLVIFLVDKGGSYYKDSREVSEFLTSAMEYTTNCSVSFDPDYSSLGELQKECNNQRDCLSGENSCYVLNKTIQNLIGESWQIGGENSIRGYRFESKYLLNRTNAIQNTSKTIILINGGNCSGGAVRGAEAITRDFPGRIITRLELCY